MRVAIGDNTESLTLVSDPKSCRFIRWILFQTFTYINIYISGQDSLLLEINNFVG